MKSLPESFGSVLQSEGRRGGNRDYLGEEVVRRRFCIRVAAGSHIVFQTVRILSILISYM